MGTEEFIQFACSPGWIVAGVGLDDDVDRQVGGDVALFSMSFFVTPKAMAHWESVITVVFMKSAKVGPPRPGFGQVGRGGLAHPGRPLNVFGRHLTTPMLVTHGNRRSV